MHNMKRCIQLLGKQKKLWIISLLFALCAVSVQVASPYIVGLCIDALQGQYTLQYMIMLLLILSAMYIVYSVGNYFMQRCAVKLSVKVALQLRTALTNKIKTIQIGCLQKYSTGDFVYRFINDVEAVSDGLLQGVATMLSGVMTIICTFFVMIYQNVTLTVIVVIFAPFLFWLAKFISTHTHKNFIEQANAAGKLHSYGKEMIESIHVVKAYGYEQEALTNFQQYNQTLYTAGVKAQFYGSLTNPSTRFINNITYAVVGSVGAYLALQNQISIGDVFSFLMYANLFAKPFTELTSVITQLQTAFTSANRIYDILDMEEEQDDVSNSLSHAKGDIKFCDVSFSYQTNQPLLQNLSLHVKAGEKVAIVGTTGAGKTTIMNVLLRFYDVQKGTIYVDDVPIQTVARKQLRQQFGMVLQETQVLEGTIIDNIRYGYEAASEEEVIHAAKESGAHSFIEALPQGYHTQLSKDQTLSKGQLQLLAITRLFLRKPSIVLLDEATSSMDSVSELQVSKALDKLMMHKTVFVIAHRLSTIQTADQILVMEHGNIVERGTHQELLQKQGVYAQLYNSQFQ